MRAYLIYILILILSNASMPAQTIDYVISDTSKVGCFKTFQDSSEINYFLKIPAQEKANGKFRIYYDNEKHKRASEFSCDSRGLTDTLKEWYETGEVKQIYHSKKYQNTDLWESTTYHKNKKVKLSRRCVSDTCITYKYYDNGKLESKLQEKGSSTFYSEKYYPNGQKMYEPHKIDWTTKWHEVLYYETGKIMQDRYWFSYSLVDGFKEFHENGKLKINGQYEPEMEYRSLIKDGYRNTYKVGKWYYYNDSGKLVREEFYDQDVLVKAIDH